MTDTSAFEVAEPILSSPFEEPPEHWWIEEGKLPERRPGRRPAGYFYRDPLAPPADDEGFTRGEWVELEAVNRIRERLAQWRAEDYPGATRTTRRADRVLAPGRPRVAALLRPARGGRDRHLPARGPLGLLQGIDVPLRGGRRRSSATPARWRPAPARRR